jgi:phosphonate transport system substrate-binding protein
MSEPSSVGHETSTGRKRTNLLWLVLVALILVGGFAAFYYFTNVRKPLAENQELNQELVTRTVGLTDARPLKLDERYIDADQDEIADPPTDPKALIDPPKLMFSYVATTDDPERYQDVFNEFMAHLSKATGKPVEYSVFKTPGHEIKAMREGHLHVAGFNTGNIPLAVNWAGFIPVCRLASPDDVSMYQMEIIVPADSPVQSIGDLRGHEITLTEPGSNSGFKAPLVLLCKDNKFRPVIDFRIRYSQGHAESILGIAEKRYEAAAVANDVLNRELAAGRIKKEQYRSIHKSQDFPTAGFGYVHSLKPELARKIKDAMFSFKWEGSKMANEFAASNQTKFVPVEYKKDWALVRRLDSEIRSTQTLDEIMASASGDEGATTAPGRPEPATTQAAPSRL